MENSEKMGIADHLTCLLRNLYAGEEATVTTEHGTTGWFQIRKRVRQGCILSPCLFSLYAEYIMRNATLDEAQADIKIARRNPGVYCHLLLLGIFQTQGSNLCLLYW